MTFSSLSLKQRVLRAGVWSLLGYIFNYAFRLGSNLLMTRLLVPEMFGLMAIAMMVLVGLALFSDVGLKPSIVQNKRGDEPLFLNTAWVVQIVRGIGLWIAAVAVGVLIAIASRENWFPKGSVYTDQNLPYVIGGLAFSMVISGFESTKLLQASRNLLIAKVTRIEIFSQILGFAATVSWAVANPTIWALVAGTLTAATARSALSHIWLPGAKNRFQWDPKAYVDILKVGKWIFLSSILFFVASNGDRILLGAMIDPVSLGTYAIAFLMFSAVDQVLSKIITDVSFPALSEVARSSRDKLQAVYYRFHFGIAVVAYFCAGLLVVSGATIIAILYDRRYQSAGWILEILAIALVVQPFRLTTQTFLAIGLAKTYFQLHAARIVVLFIALPLGFHIWGLPGAVCGIVLSYFSSLPLTLFYSRKAGLLDLKKEFPPMLAIILGAAVGEVFNILALGFRH